MTNELAYADEDTFEESEEEGEDDSGEEVDEYEEEI
jgi:hypothetical protein